MSRPRSRAWRIIRRSLLILAGLVALVFGALCYVLYAHEQEIADELIAWFNEGQEGQLSYHHVELSPFRAFPYISIDLNDVRFEADKHTADDPAIYAFNDVYVGFDVFDLLRGEYTVRKLVLSNGHLFLEKYADGTYNIVRAKARAGEDEEGATHLDLKKIELREITLHEQNHGGEGNELVMDILQADAYLSSIGEEMKMGLESEIFLQFYRSGTTTWFQELPFALDCDMRIDGGMLTILPSTFAVEAGKLDLHGTLDLDNDLMLDLTVSGRKKNFDTFIAFAPPEVLTKLKEFKNEGDIFFDGRITGPIDIRSPLIDLRLGCANTVFHHKSHNKALRDVAFTGHFRTGDDGSLENGFLELVNLYGEPEKGLMKGTIRVDDLVDPRITMDFHARFDLAHLRTFYELEAIEDGSGIVNIDITLDEYVGADSVLHFATKMTDGVTSNIHFEDVSVKLAALNRPVERLNGKILLDGDDLRSEGLRVDIGHSDVAIDFAVSNVSAMLHHNSKAPVGLRLHGESAALHMAELLALNGKAVDEPWARDTVLDLKFDLDVHTTVDALDHARFIPAATIDFRHLEFRTAKYPHHLDDVRGTIAVSDDQLKIDDLTFTLGRNDVHADVEIGNLIALLDSNRRETVTHRMTLRSAYFNAKELLVYDGRSMIHDSIEEEVVRDLVFRGSGSLQSNTFSKKGFISDTHIDHLTVRVNDLPALRDVDGRIRTDTSGCVTLKDLKLAIGTTDLFADMYLKHFLDGDLAHKHIEGSIRSENIDFNEIASWSGTDKDTTAHAEAFNLFALAFPEMTLDVDIGKLSYHKAKVRKVNGHIRTTKAHQVFVDTLRFRAARGQFAMRGIFNGADPDSIILGADLHADSVALRGLLYRMDNFGQDFVVNDNLGGRASGILRIDAHMHPDLVPDLAHTTVVAGVTVHDGRLKNFAPLHAMADFMGDKDLDDVQFGELRNTFTFRDGALHIPEMKVTSTLGYLYLSGRQSVDLEMDYTLRLPLSLVKQAAWNTVKSKLRGTGRNKEEEAELEQADAEIISGQKGPFKGYLTMNVTGTPDDYKVKLGKGKNRQ